MKNFRTLCASTVLILYALLAGASIDSNGDFEGWFIALCIIVPIVIILGIVVYKANLDAEKDNARKNIPNTKGLTRAMTHHPLKQWIAEAGIKKKITFHLSRHCISSFSLKTNDLQN